MDRRDLEEVGEAVEALGIMLEKQLGTLRQGLAELYRMLAQDKEDEKGFRKETKSMGQQITEMRTSVEQLGNIQSRTESRLADLQTGLSEEEDLTGEIKNDLLAIKRDLQLLRSDMKELLERQERLEKRHQDFNSDRGESESQTGQDRVPR